MAPTSSVSRFRSYGIATAYVVVSTLLAHVMQRFAQLEDLAMIQLLGVVLLSIRSSVREAMFACVLSIVAFDFLFIPPRFAFAWTDVKSSLIFIAMLVVAGVISSLNQRLRRQEKVARAAAYRAEALYELNVELSSAGELRQLVAVTSRHLERLLSARVTILLGSPENWSGGSVDARAREAAEQAWLSHGYMKEERTDGASIWMPIVGLHVPLGVIGVSVSEGFERDSMQGFLLSACANQLASSMERVKLADIVHRTELEAEAERLRSSLLSAVSHDLKTPLTTIIAAGSALLGRRAELDPSTQSDLLSTIVGEGERLNRLIHNLLSIARLESPSLELRKTPEAVDEIVSAAVDRFDTPAVKRRISVTLDPDLPLISAEPLLLEQVFLNLFENATKYAGSDAHISVSARAMNDVVAVQVADDGPGIPAEERDKVFEKFYRGRSVGKGDGGVGLGLTICRAIVQSHGGRIDIRERNGGGTLIEFTLPTASAANAEVCDKHAMAS